MVIAQIAKEILKLGVRAGSRYYKAEGRAFKSLYKGSSLPRGVGRGARHGLTAGSIAGTFINSPADDTPGNGIQKRIQRKYPPRKPYQTRRGQTSRSRPCKPEYNRFGKSSRFSSRRRYY